jgi:putative heme iron utilization protein
VSASCHLCVCVLQNLPEELIAVVEAEGNQNCMDCGAEKPEWGE